MNLAHLRSLAPSPDRPEHSQMVRLLARATQINLSRRDMVKLVLFALAAKPIAERLMEDTGRFALARSRGRVAFLLDGEEKWVLDVRDFGGRPRLDVTRAGERTIIRLSRATFPGTDLPADLECSYVTSDPAVLAMRMELGRFAAEVPIIPWLSGVKPLESAFRPAGFAVVLPGKSKLVLRRGAMCTYTPDGTFLIEGRSIGVLSAGGQRLRFDALTLALSEGTSGGLLAGRVRRRCSMRVYSEEGWTLGPRELDGAGVVYTDEGVFDSASVEAAETGQGKRYAALVLHASRVGRSAVFCPDGHTERIELPLANPRFAYSIAGGDAGWMFLAEFDESETWIKDGPFPLLVSGGEGATGLEVIKEPGSATHVSCSPGIRGIGVPLPGSTSGVIRFPWIMEPSATVPLVGTASAESVTSASAIVLPAGSYVNIVRPEDLLVLKVRFYDFQIEASPDGEPPRLKMVQWDQQSHMVFEFPPQAIFEDTSMAILDPGATPVVGGISLDSRRSPTRLAFSCRSLFPGSGIPLTIESLLDWDQEWMFPSLVKTALSTESNAFSRFPEEPGEKETAIVAPVNLVLSPDEKGRWTHSAALKPGPTYEQWNTRLGTGASGYYDATPVEPGADLRAVWSVWHNPGSSDFLNQWRGHWGTLMPENCLSLVENMVVKRFDPARAKHLILTSTGATLDIAGAWPDAEIVKSWAHRTTGGRDQYCKIVVFGHLYPFGHKAIWIVTTRRVIDSNGIAYLVSEAQLVILEYVREYEADNGLTEQEARRFPFSSVEILETDLPNFAPGAISVGLTWPIVGGEAYYRFKLRARSRYSSEDVLFDVPLLFIDGTSPSSALLNSARVQYESRNTYGSGSQGIVDFGKRKLVYAPPDVTQEDPSATEAEGTCLETAELAFTGATPMGGAPVPFLPALRWASVVLSQAAALAGPGAPAEAEAMEYAPIYLDGVDDGFGPDNPLQLWFQLLDPEGIVIGLPPSQSGGMASPSFIATGLSRTTGLAWRLLAPDGQAVAAASDGTWVKIKDFLGELVGDVGWTAGKLLGTLLIEDLFPDEFEDLTSIGDGKSIPMLKQRVLPMYSFGEELDELISMTYLRWEYEWKPNAHGFYEELRNSSGLILTPKPHEKPSRLVLQSVYTKRLSGKVKPEDEADRQKDDAGRQKTAEFDTKLVLEPFKELTRASKDGVLKNASYDGFDFVEAQVTAVHKEGNPLEKYTKGNDYVVRFNKESGYTHVFRTAGGQIGADTGVHIKYKYGTVSMGAGARGEFENFGLVLLPGLGKDFQFLEIQFERLRVESLTGKATTYDAKIGKVQFLGVLSFLTDFEKYLGNLVGASGVKLKVDFDSVTAGYEMAVPELTLGPFALSGVRLGAKVTVFFNGSPIVVEFNISSKENPFQLAIMGLGGGGYLKLCVSGGETGIEFRELVACLEFGGVYTFKIGAIVSGKIEAMGGVLYKKTTSSVALTAYFKVAGRVRLIGLVDISIVLMLGLTFVEKVPPHTLRSSLTGKAMLKATVDLGLWSKSFELTYEVEIAGSDPTFGEAFTQAEFDEYCDAFALVQGG